ANHATSSQACVSHPRQPTCAQGHGSARLYRRDKWETQIALPARLCTGTEPDEWVWSHMKRNGTAKRPLAKNESLQDRIEADLFETQKNPALVRSFFGAPVLAYISD